MNNKTQQFTLFCPPLAPARPVKGALSIFTGRAGAGMATAGRHFYLSLRFQFERTSIF